MNIYTSELRNLSAETMNSIAEDFIDICTTGTYWVNTVLKIVSKFMITQMTQTLSF